MPKMQSAYRQFHSTETAATKVFNDLLLEEDGGKMKIHSRSDFQDAINSIRRDTNDDERATEQANDLSLL